MADERLDSYRRHVPAGLLILITRDFIKSPNLQGNKPVNQLTTY